MIWVLMCCLVPPGDPQDKRTHLSTGLGESSGIFSLAAAAGQAPKSFLGLQNDISHLRQRTVVSNSGDWKTLLFKIAGIYTISIFNKAKFTMCKTWFVCVYDVMVYPHYCPCNSYIIYKDKASEIVTV